MKYKAGDVLQFKDHNFIIIDTLTFSFDARAKAIQWKKLWLTISAFVAQKYRQTTGPFSKKSIGRLRPYYKLYKSKGSVTIYAIKEIGSNFVIWWEQEHTDSCRSLVRL